MNAGRPRTSGRGATVSRGLAAATVLLCTLALVGAALLGSAIAGAVSAASGGTVGAVRGTIVLVVTVGGAVTAAAWSVAAWGAPLVASRDYQRPSSDWTRTVVSVGAVAAALVVAGLVLGGGVFAAALWFTLITAGGSLGAWLGTRPRAGR